MRVFSDVQGSYAVLIELLFFSHVIITNFISFLTRMEYGMCKVQTKMFLLATTYNAQHGMVSRILSSKSP